MRCLPGFLLASLLPACSEYALGKGNGDPVGASPNIELQGLSTRICSGPLETSVVARNEGDGDLTITALTTTGNWVASTTLPTTLAPGEGLLISLSGEGTGTLTVTSDDPADPALTVDLVAALNYAPEVSITSPGDYTTWPEPASEQTLTGTVSDADGEELTVTWTADGTLLASETVPPGTVSTTWTPSVGSHSITLTAEDACGLSTVTHTVCQDETSTSANLGISTWHYEGSAYWDSGNAYLVLTDAYTDQVGTAFDTTATVSGGAVDIVLDFYIGEGSGADGLSLTALDTARMTTFLGGTGCGIGYGGNAACTGGPALPGWSLEIDTYHNGGYDPTVDDHVAFSFDGDPDSPAAWAPLPEMEGTGWHQLEVHVADPYVAVSIDGVTYIDQNLSGYFGFPAYVGFTAGTGSETNRHLIRDLTVTDRACD